MRARGFRTPRARAHIGTALGVALAGLSIGLATPASAAPEGPDYLDETPVEQESQGSVVIVDRLGPVQLNRSRVSGVGPGLAPLELNRSILLLDAG